MVDSSKHAKNRTHAHHDVEVCDHEIRVVHIHVKCRVRQNDACQSACHKSAHQADAEQHGWREPQVALPKGGDVVEGLHRRGDGNQKRCENKHRSQEGVHASHKHVVTPDNEAQKPNAEDGTNHGLVPKNGLARVGGNHLRTDAQCWQQHDVHLRVTQEPEQVLE